ncbi:MAG: hypothetical protein GVY10_00525 [Verrucomicrobia bacterium]|jgi:hypothetical protein|nr:hypothetical protein [Verrucomicrobiota bacterium]
MKDNLQEKIVLARSRRPDFSGYFARIESLPDYLKSNDFVGDQILQLLDRVINGAATESEIRTFAKGLDRFEGMEIIGSTRAETTRLPLELRRPKMDLFWMLPGLLMVLVLPWLLGAPIFVSWFLWTVTPVALLLHLPGWTVRLRLDEEGISQRRLFSRWHVPWLQVMAWNWTDPVKQTHFGGSTVLFCDRRDGAVHAIAPKLIRPSTRSQVDAIFQDMAGEAATGSNRLRELRGPRKNT